MNISWKCTHGEFKLVFREISWSYQNYESTELTHHVIKTNTANIIRKMTKKIQGLQGKKASHEFSFNMSINQFYGMSQMLDSFGYFDRKDHEGATCNQMFMKLHADLLYKIALQEVNTMILS